MGLAILWYFRRLTPQYQTILEHPSVVPGLVKVLLVFDLLSSVDSGFAVIAMHPFRTFDVQ
jgi:hypothetical protein